MNFLRKKNFRACAEKTLDQHFHFHLKFADQKLNELFVLVCDNVFAAEGNEYDASIIYLFELSKLLSVHQTEIVRTGRVLPNSDKLEMHAQSMIEEWHRRALQVVDRSARGPTFQFVKEDWPLAS